ncbi:MAG: sugar phosphate isomerase/epimerase [Candidatus Omnitrophica bacterium]|nr:sugar phosphate isomerase/epimerase [Candidatus Omnitrophota bacterium]
MVKKEILPLGVMTGIRANPMEALSKIRALGIPTCQLGNPPDEYIYAKEADRLNEELKSAIRKTGIKISSVFIMYKGHIWNLIDGPGTIGLVPENTRAPRVVHACAVSNWAKKIGINVVTSHMGFIPADNTSLVYKGFIDTMKRFVAFCKGNDQIFAFETGQEPPLVLRRTIDDIGADNVRVNLDSANLLMYGMGTPLEAVRLLGEFVVNTHCKDGKMPQEKGKLGPEMPLGEGDVHYEEVLPALYEKGFRGPLTIEREISGVQQIKDIKKAIKLLEKIKEKLLRY